MKWYFLKSFLYNILHFQKKQCQLVNGAKCWYGFIVLLCLSFTTKADVFLRNTTLSTQVAQLASECNQAPLLESQAQILAFDHSLSDNEKSQLQKRGIHFLHYIPDNAWLCRIHPADNTVEAASENGDSISFLSFSYQPEYKILKSMTDIPGWDRSGTVKKIRVILTQDTPDEHIEKISSFIHAKINQIHRSKNGIFCTGSATGAVLEKLTQDPYVLWIEPVAQFKPTGEVAAKIVGGDNYENHYTYSQFLGYDGSGVITGVADTGLDTGDFSSLHPDLAGHVKAMYYYGDVDSAMDEYGHGTHVSGSIIANGLRGFGTLNEDGYLYGLGVAPGAQLVAQRVIDSTGTVFLTEDFQCLARDAYREGVSVVNNSWGAEESSRYDSYAAEYDALVRDSDNLTSGDQEMAFIFAAGNSGSAAQTLITPGVAKNVITVGASQSDRQVMYIYEDGIDAMADFSSRGPTEDGRYKPDIVGPGTWISSTKSAYAGEGNEWLGIDDNYTYMGGTSMASPIITGAAAVIIQYFQEKCPQQTPSPALLKALLISCAQDMDNTYGTDYAPNFDEGWGRVWLPEIIDGDYRICENQSVLLRQGEEWERQVLVKSSESPLKITMAYTDVPGLPSVIPSLVNDLDLTVIAPDGTIYYGNQFIKGTSVSGSSPDRINNVEGFYVEAPSPGLYIVKVSAYRIASDSRKDTMETDQDFALVISGDLAVQSDENLLCLKGDESIPLPNEGLLFLDRNFYTSPDTIQITLFDPDLDPQSSVEVRLYSDSDPIGSKLTLEPKGNFGFRLTFDLNQESLAVANGDTLTVEYEDSYPKATIKTTAKVDLIPPVIFQQNSYFSFGKTTFIIQTDTLTLIKLHYGLPGEINKTITTQVYDTEHEFNISGLKEGAYLYWIEATDQAGNVTIVDNDGIYFEFDVEKSATILLVDGIKSTGSSYDIGFGLGFDVTPPPLSGFTDCLDELGYEYELWSVSELGKFPVLEDLIAYDVVLWRVHDMAYLDLVTTYIIPAESLNAITDYVKGGGAFFLSSMEILSHGNSNFQKQILHVESFSEDTEVTHINGISGNKIGNSVSTYLDYTEFPRLSEFFDLGPDLSDTIIVTDDAEPIFYGDEGIAGVQYPRTGTSSTDGRVVFFSFPIDAIPMGGENPNNRTEIFRRVLQFLCPGLDGYGNLAFLDSAYTVPSMANIELSDSDLINESSVTITVHTDIDSTPRSIEMLPTVYPGTFSASVVLAEPDKPESSEYLRAEDEDHLYAEYHDESTGRTESINVIIDTVPPMIYGTEIETDYMDAIISWETDEESDSLVEFGETPTLGRTVYNGLYTYDHIITVTNLLPDKLYYFRITSRDMARNSASDDNEGKLYQYRTPTPLSTPWTDDFETENSLWLSMSDDSTWQWGIPAIWERGIPSHTISDIVPGANSGKYCYGINMNGNQSEVSIAALFSPAVYIPENSTALLEFATAYDMIAQDDYVILNAGEVSITTDNGATWTTLLSISDDSTYGQWEEISIDLSKWAGKTIRIQWYYNFLTLWSDQKPGWYIDDVSITSKHLETGMLRIGTQLSAGNWTLTSSSSSLNNITGGGFMWTTNAPTGHEYTVTYGDIPWYITPASETKSLHPGQKSVSFEGIYTMIDDNKNNIPDEWERYFFQDLLDTKKLAEDSDGDGLCNYDEFFAGTDPLNTLSNLSLSIDQQESGAIALTWLGVKGKTYQLQYSSDAINYISINDSIRAEKDGELTIYISPMNTGSQTAAFYRLECTP